MPVLIIPQNSVRTFQGLPVGSSLKALLPVLGGTICVHLLSRQLRRHTRVLNGIPLDHIFPPILSEQGLLLIHLLAVDRLHFTLFCDLSLAGELIILLESILEALKLVLQFLTLLL